ncbi:PilZ domain-containing protein [bacterium]|nr:PilZ domain-containing protein [bacterium]
MSQSNRRTHLRETCLLPAQLAYLQPGGELRPHTFLVMMSDVSTAGARLRCPTGAENWMPREGGIALLTLGDGACLHQISCRVVWRSPRNPDQGRKYDELGIAFDIRDPSSQRSAEYVLTRGRQSTPRPITPYAHT